MLEVRNLFKALNGNEILKNIAPLLQMGGNHSLIYYV